MRTRTWIVLGAIAIVGVHLRRTRDVIASVPVPVSVPLPQPARASIVVAPTLNVQDTPAEHPAEVPDEPTLTNAIVGEIRDPETGDPLVGTTIIATDRDGRSIVVISGDDDDDRSTYTIADLAPGLYHVTFYYADRVDTRDVEVTSTDASKLDEDLANPPRIDPTSTVQGITIDTDYIVNIPVPGRTFESALGAAAGSQDDSEGISFTGTTSLENTYISDED